MKFRRAMLVVLIVTLFAGCATDRELSQKERDAMTREMDKANRREAQNQAKMMRESGQRRSSR